MLYAGEPSRLSRYKLYKTIPTDGGEGGGGGGGGGYSAKCKWGAPLRQPALARAPELTPDVQRAACSMGTKPRRQTVCLAMCKRLVGCVREGLDGQKRSSTLAFTRYCFTSMRLYCTIMFFANTPFIVQHIVQYYQLLHAPPNFEVFL